MDWLEITINTAHGELDGLCFALTELGITGLVIEDETDFKEFLESNRQYWDYVDDELLENMRGRSLVKFYLPADGGEDARAVLSAVEALRTENAGCRAFEIKKARIREEDWANNWKQYYKPFTVGKRLIIAPEWERPEETGGRTAIILDPGVAFGTGMHPSTQLCLEALEERIAGGERVLDIGCGSGILSIAAILLGASKAAGCDIDPGAVDIAASNAALNRIYGDRFSVLAGNILEDGGLRDKLSAHKYDIVLANIVADVIIALAPMALELVRPGGIFVCSGIIEERTGEVVDALQKSGFENIELFERKGWAAITAVRQA